MESIDFDIVFRGVSLHKTIYRFDYRFDTNYSRKGVTLTRLLIYRLFFCGVDPHVL